MRPECEQFRGRKRDLCEGRGFDGRKHPTQQHSDRLRLRFGLDSIEVTIGEPTESLPAKPRDDLKRMTVSAIGTTLSKIFHDRIGQVPCGDCKAEIARLNTMTATDVMDDIDAIAARIIANAKRNAKWWLKLSVKTLEAVGSELHEQYIKSCIAEACETQKS